MKTAFRAVGSLLIVAAIVFMAKWIAHPAGSQGGATSSGSGDLTLHLRVKDKLISGAYKVYGLKDSANSLWLAKSVFKNETGAPIKDLKVRYKLGEYADWCSWQEYPEVAPSQTVVDLYSPILSSKVAQLSSKTPAELSVEYEYVDAAGHKKQTQRNERLDILGHREFYFTDLKQEEQSGSFQDSDTYSALLAAWVTYADEPVARLASLANKRAGGAAASLDEKQCIAAMKECYDLMRDIKITYQTPPFSSEPGKDYEPVGIQALQFPRDTIEKRSGTCIDLAILYAAMIKSIGITPYLVSKDGHCFPMGVTPNGQIIAVEATCVRGGADSDNFDKAVQIGAKEWQEVNKTGRFNLVKLDELWGSGISPPELEHMPADILERWNISDMVLKGQRPGPAPVVETNNVAPVALAAGNWTFTTSWPNGGATRGTAMFVVNGKQVQIVATATYLVLGYDNLQHKAFEQDTFNGILTGTNLAAQCNNLVATLDGQNVPPQGLPFVLKMVVGNDGKSAHGTVTNAMGNSGQVTMNAQ